MDIHARFGREWEAVTREEYPSLWYVASPWTHGISCETGCPLTLLNLSGGSPESQREFLDSLSNSDPRRLIDRQRIPPIANNFALGYTYYDVLDSDQEGSSPLLPNP